MDGRNGFDEIHFAPPFRNPGMMIPPTNNGFPLFRSCAGFRPSTVGLVSGHKLACERFDDAVLRCISWVWFGLICLRFESGLGSGLYGFQLNLFNVSKPSHGSTPLMMLMDEAGVPA